MGIISVPAGGIETPVTFIGQRLKEFALETIRIESVGSNKVLGNLLGKEFPLAKLQDWADGRSSPDS
jgi:hypothetical protein